MLLEKNELERKKERGKFTMYNLLHVDCRRHCHRPQSRKYWLMAMLRDGSLQFIIYVQNLIIKIWMHGHDSTNVIFQFQARWAYMHWINRKKNCPDVFCYVDLNFIYLILIA